MSQSRVNRGELQIAAQLDAFVADQVAPGTGVSVEAFWAGFEACLKDLGPVNRELLAVRESLQKQIDEWHRARKGQPIDEAEYKLSCSPSATCCPSHQTFPSKSATLTVKSPRSPVPNWWCQS